MKLPDVSVSDVAVVGTYVAAIWLPGTMLGAAAGLRRWRLVTLSPLFTYALAGLGGPLYAHLGVRWAPVTFAVGAVLAAAVVLAARLLLRRWRPIVASPPTPGWGWWAWAGVAAAIAVAFAVGIVSILGGIEQLSALPQDWDAVFHANGIRLIMDTGDGGLFAMAGVNWYEGGIHVFYPNAYHLLAAVVGDLTGAPVPTVLNAQTVLLPGLIGISLVAMIRRCGGSPFLAGSAALIAAATSSFYDLLWRGPLLPFATGVALIPLAVVLLSDALDARGVHARLAPTLLLALGAAGLLCIHPAVLISAVLFALPFLVQRWWSRPREILVELAGLVVAGVAAAAMAAFEIAGALTSASSLDTVTWPADLSASDALGQVLLYGHGGPPQWGLALAMLVGLVLIGRLTRMRWLVAAAAIFGILFVITASVEAQWAKTITGFWWNDRWRLIALTALPLTVIAAHGIEQCWSTLVRWGATLRLVPRDVPRVLAALVVIAFFGLATRGLYIGQDQFRMKTNSGNGPAVSRTELAGMYAAAALVPPGSRVLNDRGDGSAWMYALTGLRPVAGHYDAARIGPDAELLAARFNHYDTEPAVRAAVAELDVHYVMINQGFLRLGTHRQPGLSGLDHADFLRVVYRNPDVVLYAIEGKPADVPGTAAHQTETGTESGAAG